MTIDYAEAARLHRKHKGALTRAKNSGDHQKILDACEAFYDAFHNAHLPLPDDWHTWDIAGWDALHAINMEAR